jgi:8-oxo-dGTP pyrophosphatase MutT (NUDIX family)
MAGTYQRILVQLQLPGSAAAVLAKFTDCLVASLHPGHTHSALVSVELQDNRLTLSPARPASSPPPVLLTHPPFCPALCLGPAAALALPPDTRDRGVDVGVVVLLETSDCRLLLTRRARHMRTFPGTWVPPGGHLEAGETLLEAGLRELAEETGLEPATTAARVLALWESVFPYSLSVGPPQRHHVVAYYWVRTTESSDDLQRRLKLQGSEVDAAMWLSPVMAQLVATGQVPPDCPASVELTVLAEDGTASQSSLPAAVLTAEAPSSGPDRERISSGTRYALQQWLAAREQEDGP